MKINKNRLYNGYYLNEWDSNLKRSACELCELTNECDKLADELNQIEYCMCLSKGVVNDTEYKLKHNKAYFKKI